MTEVVIAGIGQTEVGEHWEIGLRELAFAAIQEAVKDLGGLKPQALFVGNMLAPNLIQPGASRRVARGLCRSTRHRSCDDRSRGRVGGAALRQGYLAVASGMVDVALVVGVEKFTDKAWLGRGYCARDHK